MNLLVLEGARGTGKSTIARTLRNRVNYATLINFTGFRDRGVDGLAKISTYYGALSSYFQALQGLESTFIADRIFFSEVVFSRLYKDYNFDEVYRGLCESLINSIDRIDLFYFTVDNEEQLQQRLLRDKVPFADVAETAEEVLRQQDEYNRVIADFESTYRHTGKVYLHRIDTTSLSPDEVQTKVLDIVASIPKVSENLKK